MINLRVLASFLFIVVVSALGCLWVLPVLCGRQALGVLGDLVGPEVPGDPGDPHHLVGIE